MSQRTHQSDAPEFKEQALGLLSLGKPASDVAQGLQISSNLLYAWRSQSHGLHGGGAGLRRVGAQSEADTLRRENARLQAENAFKKAATIVSPEVEAGTGTNWLQAH